MPEVLMVIAPQVFRDEEYAEPMRVLNERGARVVTASLEPGECIGKLGMRATAEVTVAEALAKTWDAVVFVGGAGAQVYFDNADAHALAQTTHKRGGIVSAICIAPSVLAHAGLLDGVQATAFPSQKDDLVAHGARWSDEPVVVSGRIVTANGPEAAEAFGVAIAELSGLRSKEAIGGIHSVPDMR